MPKKALTKKDFDNSHQSFINFIFLQIFKLQIYFLPDFTVQRKPHKQWIKRQRGKHL